MHLEGKITHDVQKGKKKHMTFKIILFRNNVRVVWFYFLKLFFIFKNKKNKKIIY